jgi:hypothetical protein
MREQTAVKFETMQNNGDHIARPRLIEFDPLDMVRRAI